MTASATETKWPSAHMVIAEQRTEIDLAPDGSSTETTSTVFQPLTEKGRVNLSLQRLSYRASKETMEITEASVIQGERITPVDRSKIVDQAVTNEEHGIADGHQLTIPFEGVTTETKVKLTYRRKTKPTGVTGWFEAQFSYGFGAPELDSRVTIKSPFQLDRETQDPDGLLKVSETQSPQGWIYTFIQNRPAYTVMDASNARDVYRLMKRVPFIIYRSRVSWKELMARVLKAMQPREAQPLPQKAQEFAATLANKPAEQKISAIRKWISENMTYSGRWTEPASDWIPRPVAEILSTHVGDCKDFAYLFVRLSRAAGLDAAVAVTRLSPETKFLRAAALVDPKPSLGIFDHAVVRVRSGTREIFIDPSIPVFQGEDSDAHLNRKPTVVLENETRGFQRIRLASTAVSKVKTTVERSLDGLRMKSSVVAEGPYAQYLQSLPFGEYSHETGRAVAAVLGYDDAKQAALYPASPFDRVSSHLKFDTDFFTKDGLHSEDGKLKYEFPTALAQMFSKKPAGAFASYDSIPMEIEVTTDFPGLNARDENASDCVVMGPLANYTRRVVNLGDRVSVKETLKISGDVLPDSGDDEDLTMIRSFNAREIYSCANTAKLELVTRNVADKTQTAFEDSINPDPEFEYEWSPEKASEVNTREWRRLVTLIERDPKNEMYLFKLNRIFDKKGMLVSRVYVPEYVTEALRLAAQGLRMNPKSEYGWFVLADTWLDLNKGAGLPQAKVALAKGFEVAPKSARLLLLAGRIAEIEKKADEAFKFYKQAESLATVDRTKTAALEGQIDILCRTKERCVLAKPAIEKRMRSKMTAWDYHNMAIHYKTMEDYKTAIYLEQRALGIMKFGAAEGVLVDALTSRVLEVLRSPSPAKEKIAEAEGLMREAKAHESADDRVNMKWAMMYLAVEKAREDHDPVMVGQARSYLEQIKPDIGSDFYERGMRLIASVEAPLANQVRRPSQEGRSQYIEATPNANYQKFYDEYQKDVQTPQGQSYDREGTQALNGQFNSALKSCFFGGGSSIEMVLLIGADGKVLDSVNKTDSSETLCMANKMRGAQTKIPPTAPFHLWVQLRF